MNENQKTALNNRIKLASEIWMDADKTLNNGYSRAASENREYQRGFILGIAVALEELGFGVEIGETGIPHIV